MVVIRGTIDETVLKCLRERYPDFAWDYGYDWKNRKRDSKTAVGHTDKFLTLASERGCIFDVLLTWFSVKDFSVYSSI